jgi:uncharacterized protein (UPF0332 family)
VTEEHAIENPREELAKSRTTLAAARVLAAPGMWDDAVSRTYYAAFHAAAALRLRAGIDAKTHHSAQARFDEATGREEVGALLASQGV